MIIIAFKDNNYFKIKLKIQSFKELPVLNAIYIYVKPEPTYKQYIFLVINMFR